MLLTLFTTPLRKRVTAAKGATECDQRDVCWSVRCCSSSWASGCPGTDATLAAQDAVDGDEDESAYTIADSADTTVTKEAAETMEDFRPTTEVRASTSTVEQSVALGAPDTTAALAHNTNKNVADDISAASSYKTKLESASQVSVMLWGYNGYGLTRDLRSQMGSSRIDVWV